MSDPVSSSTTAQLAARLIGIAAAGLFTHWMLGRQDVRTEESKQESSGSVSSEEAQFEHFHDILSAQDCEEILREIAHGDFELLTDLSQLAAPLRRQHSNAAEVRTALLSSSVKDALKEQEKLVLVKRGFPDNVALSTFAKYCKHIAGTSDEVARLVVGLEAMVEDALAGILPVMPETPLDPEVTPDNILGFFAALQRAQREEALKVLKKAIAERGRDSCPWMIPIDIADGVKTMDLPDDISESLAKAMKACELSMVAGNESRLGNKHNWLQAVAKYSRDPAFAAEWRTLQELHNSQLIEEVGRLTGSGQR